MFLIIDGSDVQVPFFNNRVVDSNETGPYPALSSVWLSFDEGQMSGLPMPIYKK